MEQEVDVPLAFCPNVVDGKSCGEKLTAKDKFCRECGHKVDQTLFIKKQNVFRCDGLGDSGNVCGFELQPNVKFCPNCGKNCTLKTMMPCDTSRMPEAVEGDKSSEQVHDMATCDIMKTAEGDSDQQSDAGYTNQPPKRFKSQMQIDFEVTGNDFRFTHSTGSTELIESSDIQELSHSSDVPGGDQDFQDMFGPDIQPLYDDQTPVNDQKQTYVQAPRNDQEQTYVQAPRNDQEQTGVQTSEHGKVYDQAHVDEQDHSLTKNGQEPEIQPLYDDQTPVNDQKQTYVQAPGNDLEQRDVQTPGNDLEQRDVQAPGNDLEQTDVQTSDHGKVNDQAHVDEQDHSLTENGGSVDKKSDQLKGDNVKVNETKSVLKNDSSAKENQQTKEIKDSPKKKKVPTATLR